MTTLVLLATFSVSVTVLALRVKRVTLWPFSIEFGETLRFWRVELVAPNKRRSVTVARNVLPGTGSEEKL